MEKREMNFSNTKERTVTDVIPFTMQQFTAALNEYKPTEIFNNGYSSKVPCWTITEYFDNNRIKYFADGWADKTPVEESMENVYKSWLVQGLSSCFIKVNPETPIPEPTNESGGKMGAERFAVDKFSKNLLTENIGQMLIETIADFLDNDDVITQELIAGVKDPEPRETTLLHVRMAEAAMVEYNRTVLAQPTPPTLLNELRELRETAEKRKYKILSMQANVNFNDGIDFVIDLLDAIIQSNDKPAI